MYKFLIIFHVLIIGLWTQALPLEDITPQHIEPETITTSPEIKVDSNSYYPDYPDYNNPDCYYKKQYGFAITEFSCYGIKYVYPVECYHCCFTEDSKYSNCNLAHEDNCKRVYHYDK